MFVIFVEISRPAVSKARFRVWYPWEIKRQAKGRNSDVDGGERADTAATEEGFGGEVRAVG